MKHILPIYTMSTLTLTSTSDCCKNKEVVANVATSLPFFAIAAALPKHDDASSAHAASVYAMGAASCAYHASFGRARPKLRWLDYATVSASTMVSSSV